MKKQTKTILWVILALVIVGGLFYFSSSQNALGSSNTLSISKATLQSSNSYLNGEAWLLTFSQGSLGQSYYGTFSPNDIQQATSDSSTTTKSFSVGVDYGKQTWNYPIQLTSYNKPIYDIQYKTWFCLIGTSESGAKSKTGFANVLWYGTDGTTCWAIGYNSQSPIGDIQNPSLQSSYTIQIQTPSGTSSKTIDINSGSTQGAIGNYAYAVWYGNLGSGLTFPSQSAYKTAYVNGIWRTISSSSYNNYVSLINQVPPSNGNYRDAFVSSLQSAVSNAKISKGFGTIDSSTNLNNAIIKITEQDPVQFPVTSLYIKASEIGIYTPTPNFVITSTDSPCFATGEQGSIKAVIRNDGESGSGNVYIQCNSPFQTTENKLISLSKGESRTLYFPLSASASSETTGTCKVYVESPAGTKSSSVSTCVKPQITCSAGSVFCGLDGGKEVIRQCASDGATSSIKEICPTGYTCDASNSDNIKCVEGGGGGGGGECKPWFSLFGKTIIPNFICLINNLVAPFRWILSILGGILAGILGLKFAEGQLGKGKRDRTLRIIVALASAIAIGVIIYIYFWWGVAILIILGLIKSFIPGL